MSNAKCTASKKNPALSLKRNYIYITKFVYERKFCLVIRSSITMWNLVCEFVCSHVCAGVFVCVWMHRDQRSGSSALHCSPQGLLLWSWLASKILGCCCLHPSELGLQRGSLACECDGVLDSLPCDHAVTVILPLSQLSHPDPEVLKGEKGFTASPGLRHRRGDRQDLWWRWHWYCPRTDKLTKGPEQRAVCLLHIHRKQTDDKGSTTIKEETEIQQSDGAESWRRNRHFTQNEASGSKHKGERPRQQRPRQQRPHQHSHINKNEYRQKRRRPDASKAWACALGRQSLWTLTCQHRLSLESTPIHWRIYF